MYKFTEQCTIWLQMESLIKCASSLGYEFNGRSFYKFKYYETIGKKHYFLSFMDMQIIHNTGLYDSAYLYVQTYIPATYRDDIKRISKDSKLVETSHLQYNKKLKCFQTTKNMIKFI